MTTPTTETEPFCWHCGAWLEPPATFVVFRDRRFCNRTCLALWHALDARAQEEP